MREEHVLFPCGELQLEGVWHLPDGERPSPAVVVCHPHPLYGGDMDNTVVQAIGEALARASIVALRFNFRGTGRSDGIFGGGFAEREDVAAALDFAATSSRVDPSRLGLAGYSFGAMVALPVAASRKDVKALALVSLPLPILGSEGLALFPGPKLLLCGGRDQIASPQKVKDYAQGLTPPVDYEVVPEADHFWFGFEDRAADITTRFFTSALAVSSGV